MSMDNDYAIEWAVTHVRKMTDYFFLKGLDGRPKIMTPEQKDRLAESFKTHMTEYCKRIGGHNEQGD